MNLIYDRTAEDAAAARQLAKKAAAGTLSDDEKNIWLAGTKGNYTEKDMNRVAAAVSALSEALNDAGYKNQISAQTFTPGEEITDEKWTICLANVQALRDAYYTLAETGELPKPEDKLDYRGANNIEKILADIDLLLDGMKSIYRRAGTFTAGGSYTKQMIRSI